jgi:hypothetical protein
MRVGVGFSVVGNAFTGVASANLPVGTSCTATVNLVGTLGGSAARTTHFTVGTLHWPPPLINALGVKVEGVNQLPVGCTSVTQQCWQDAVASGLVKFVATSATAVGVNSRPIVFAYFRNTTSSFGVDGLWNVLPLYADDGSRFGADIFGGGAVELDMVQGNTEGAVIRETVTGDCYQVYWNGINWTAKRSACPI